jgi:hypothetical protein
MNSCPKIHQNSKKALFFLTCAASATFLTGMLAPKNTIPQNVANASGVFAILAGATLYKKEKKHLDCNSLIKTIFKDKENIIELRNLIYEINAYKNRYKNDDGLLHFFNGMASQKIFNIADLTPNSFYSVDTIDFLLQFKLYKDLPDSSNTKYDALTKLSSMYSQSGFFECLAYRAYLGNEMALIAINDTDLKGSAEYSTHSLFQNSIIEKFKFHKYKKDFSSILGLDTVTKMTEENNNGINNLFQNSDYIKTYTKNILGVDQNTFKEMMEDSDHSEWQKVFDKIADSRNSMPTSIDERFSQLEERPDNHRRLSPATEDSMLPPEIIATTQQLTSKSSR